MKGMLEKTVLITGASGDIGKACSHAFGDAGVAQLVLHSHRHSDALKSVVEKYSDERVITINCDATSEEEVSREFKKLTEVHAVSNIDILVVNTGDLLRRCSFEDMSWGLVQASLDVNLKSAYLFTRCSLPMMRDGSSIVYVTSQTGRSGGGDRSSHYGIAKSALTGMAICLSSELADRGIRVNCVAPGFIEGQFHKKYTVSAVTKKHANKNPLRRNGCPNDVAKTVLFLGSNMSDYITGVTIDVCGGNNYI